MRVLSEDMGSRAGALVPETCIRWNTVVPTSHEPNSAPARNGDGERSAATFAGYHAIFS
jgi:hypothetical protein